MTKAHKLYLIQQIAQFNDSPSVLRENLSDIEICERHGFKPVEMSYSRIHTIMRGFDKELIASKRAQYLADFSDVPLAFKKNRLLELQKMFNELILHGVDYGKGVMRMKLEIINQISKETNENFDKLIEAINVKHKKPLILRKGALSTIDSLTTVILKFSNIVIKSIMSPDYKMFNILSSKKTPSK